MKAQYHILITSVVYTYLLYNQGAGVNILVLNLLLIPVLLYYHRQSIRNKYVMLFSGGALLSAAIVFIIGHSLAVYSNILSLLLLSISILKNNNTVASNLIQGLYNYLTSFYFVITEAINKIKTASNTNNFLKTNMVVYLCSIAIFCIFISFYRYSNSAFNAVVLQLNINFISLKLVSFYLCSFVLMYAYFKPRTYNVFTLYEQGLNNHLESTPFSEYLLLGSKVTQHTEYKTGTMMLSLLNILLLLVNALDLQFMYNGVLPENTSFSEFVHQGIFSLILSLLSAIAILLWYFRGSLNYHQKATLKTLAVIWIFQNILMVISAMYKNHLYILQYDITYKRIGVYIFLLCTIAGLMLTYVKIIKRCTNWFLIQMNTLVWYLFLICLTPVNWDKRIASYNINAALAKGTTADLRYLYSLSFQALPLVLKYDLKTNKHTKYLAIDDNLKYVYDNRLAKIESLIEAEDQYTWQSYNMQRSNMYNELSNLLPPSICKGSYLKASLRLKTFAECRNLYKNGNNK